MPTPINEENECKIRITPEQILSVLIFWIFIKIYDFTFNNVYELIVNCETNFNQHKYKLIWMPLITITNRNIVSCVC